MKKYGKYLVLALLVVAVAVSGVSAYFTATDSAENKFNVHEFGAELLEPAWDALPDTNDNDIPDVAEGVVPNQTIAKDPQVHNTGTADQYVFLKVTVPVADIATAAADGTPIAAARTELFSFVPDANWALVHSVEETDANVYYYAYGTKTAMTALAADATTAPLFEQVTVVNAIENDALEGSQQIITVDMYAIQADNIADVTDPFDILNVYLRQNSKDVLVKENNP
jgi:predicted ribosomally synthesized peptide with SipW-like signal peptide